MDKPVRTDSLETQERPAAAPEIEGGAQKAGLYDRFAELAHDIFNAGQDKGRDAWEKAMEGARQRMMEAGEFTAEQGETFKRYLQRDLDQTNMDMRKLGQSAKETLHPARLGAGALAALAKVMQAAGHALTELSAKTESALEYESGEITMAGTLTCLSCGTKVELRKTSVVPQCPKCQGKRFRKGY